MNRVKKSTIAALFALGFLVSLLCMSLATPNWNYDVAYAGILISGAMTVYLWKRERKVGSKASPFPIWLILLVLILFVVLCFLVPAL